MDEPTQKTIVSTPLTPSTLGMISQAFNDELAAMIEIAVADCRRRPGVTKPRKIAIEFAFTPNANDAADVDLEPIVKPTKLPGQVVCPDPIRGQVNPHTNAVKFNHVQNELFDDYVEPEPPQVEPDEPHDGKAAAAGDD